jgi:hypothetical protein
MNLTHDLSFLKDVSKNDRKLISGGATVSGSFSGTGSSSSSSSSSSSYSISFKDGVYTGRGRTSGETKIDGVVTDSFDKSFDYGPSRVRPSFGSFSFSIGSRVD